MSTRCAIYTRKSSEEGLEQEFNSLDAQRESAELFIASQKEEGWSCLPDRYDDGGFTGGNMDRPALKRLLADIETGMIDCVVVYKVDRLSRSLIDFARIMEIFETHNVSFVSVTQQFNTTSSMGRLMLNVLLSFAQFEREIISERTRDKIAAARRKGKWAGGRPLLGYDVERSNRGSRLLVNDDEAERVRQIFHLYLELGSIMPVVKELNGRGWCTKRWTTKKDRSMGGRPFTKNNLFHLLTNVTYRGKIRHKDQIFDGEHEAIVSAELWNQVQSRLQRNSGNGASGQFRNKYGALLGGLLFCSSCGYGMTHTYTTRGNKRYRYYVCIKAQKQGWHLCPTKSVPAAEIERFVLDEIRCITEDPALIDDTVCQARAQSESEIGRLERERGIVRRELARIESETRDVIKSRDGSPHATARLADLEERRRAAEQRVTEIEAELATHRRQLVSEEEVRAAFARFDDLWATLKTRERTQILQLLIERIEYDGDTGELVISFHPSGIRGLVDHQLEGAA